MCCSERSVPVPLSSLPCQWGPAGSQCSSLTGTAALTLSVRYDLDATSCVDMITS